jgi:paraquat-inducible protein B
MTGEELPPQASEDLPVARQRRPGLLSVVVWIIPIIALVVAAFLVYQRVQQYGPQITIRFKDGGGLRVGQTPIKYRGVQVGEVTGVELSGDHEYVLVQVRMRHSAAGLASEGATFWIVRPQVGFGNVTGLNTVITGPEIQVMPGNGEKEARQFTGLERAPVDMGQPGIKVLLKAEKPRSIKANTPVFYRGVQVGVVQEVSLAANASAAEIHVLIWEGYGPLVRTGSAFWNVSGATVKGGIFKGVEVDVESLRALAVGGIEFASPEGSPHAKSGTVFFLHNAPQPAWLAWNPKIPIRPQPHD